MTSVSTLEKSGTIFDGSNARADTPPVAKYATRPPMSINTGTTIPPTKPIFDIRAVSFVPPSCVSVKSHTITATPTNITRGLS